MPGRRRIQLGIRIRRSGSGMFGRLVRRCSLCGSDGAVYCTIICESLLDLKERMSESKQGSFPTIQ